MTCPRSNVSYHECLKAYVCIQLYKYITPTSAPPSQSHGPNPTAHRTGAPPSHKPHIQSSDTVRQAQNVERRDHATKPDYCSPIARKYCKDVLKCWVSTCSFGVRTSAMVCVHHVTRRQGSSPPSSPQTRLAHAGVDTISCPQEPKPQVSERQSVRDHENTLSKSAGGGGGGGMSSLKRAKLARFMVDTAGGWNRSVELES